MAAGVSEAALPRRVKRLSAAPAARCARAQGGRDAGNAKLMGAMGVVAGKAGANQARDDLAALAG
jgi:hypothetical protein